MKYVAPRLHGSWLKILLGIKILVIVGVFVVPVLRLRFGDQSLIAAGEGVKGVEEAPPLAKNEGVAPGAKAIEEDPEGSPRKGYLDDLLYLPDMATEGAKKEEIAQYQLLLERKKQQIDGRIDLLKKREALLQELETSIDTKLKKLDDEIAFFQQTQQKEKQIQKDRLSQLVEFYKKMAPKQAAPVFEKLDKDLVVALWIEFPQKQTQAILSLMNPDKAVELSEYFGRLRSAKEYDLLKEINTALRKEFEDCKGLPKTESN